MDRNQAGMDREARLTLLALGGVLGVTVAWWALALWPAPGTPPEWLARARAVCFNAGPTGLPDVSGWILLIGQPAGMFGFLFVVWPRSVARALRLVWRRPVGRAVLVLVGLSVSAGLTGAGIRVANASSAAAPPRLPQGMAAADHPRMDRPAPPLGLQNQAGERIELAHLAGRPGMVTFAFGHCGDICPLVVEAARRARDRVWGSEGAFLVVVTLDPWRDTPGRLPSLARQWGLAEGDHVLSGDVADVQAVLDGWNVARVRDPKTGDISHPPLTYLLDSGGTIAYTTLSGASVMAQLATQVE